MQRGVRLKMCEPNSLVPVLRSLRSRRIAANLVRACMCHDGSSLFSLPTAIGSHDIAFRV